MSTSRPASPASSYARRDADADDDEVALEHPAAGGAHARHRAVALERLDSLAEQQLDPVLGVHVAVEGADLCAEDALVGQRERIDDRDLEAALARRGRELAADPAGADDHDPATGLQALAQRVAVLQRAQVMDAVELGARDRDPARLGARGQQQPVVVEARARRRA